MNRKQICAIITIIIALSNFLVLCLPYVVLDYDEAEMANLIWGIKTKYSGYDFFELARSFGIENLGTPQLVLYYGIIWQMCSAAGLLIVSVMAIADKVEERKFYGRIIGLNVLGFWPLLISELILVLDDSYGIKLGAGVIITLIISTALDLVSVYFRKQAKNAEESEVVFFHKPTQRYLASIDDKNRIHINRHINSAKWFANEEDGIATLKKCPSYHADEWKCIRRRDLKNVR